MTQRLKAFLKFAAENGLYFPGAYDANQKSVNYTLLFAYVSFILSVGIIIYLSLRDRTQATIASLLLFTVSTAFYLMRHLTKFKADLDAKSLELEDDIKEDSK